MKNLGCLVLLLIYLEGVSQSLTERYLQLNYSAGYIGNNIGAELELQKNRHLHRFGLLFAHDHPNYPSSLGYHKSQHFDSFLDHFGIAYAYGFQVLSKENLRLHILLNNQLLYTKFFQKGIAPFAKVYLDSTGQEYLLSVHIPYEWDNRLSLQSHLGLRATYQINKDWAVTNALLLGITLIYDHDYRDHRYNRDLLQALEEASGLRPQYQFGIAYRLPKK